MHSGRGDEFRCCLERGTLRRSGQSPSLAPRICLGFKPRSTPSEHAEAVPGWLSEVPLNASSMGLFRKKRNMFLFRDCFMPSAGRMGGPLIGIDFGGVFFFIPIPVFFRCNADGWAIYFSPLSREVFFPPPGAGPCPYVIPTPRKSKKPGSPPIFARGEQKRPRL